MTFRAAIKIPGCVCRRPTVWLKFEMEHFPSSWLNLFTWPWLDWSHFSYFICLKHVGSTYVGRDHFITVNHVCSVRAYNFFLFNDQLSRSLSQVLCYCKSYFLTHVSASLKLKIFEKHHAPKFCKLEKLPP